MIYLLKKRGQAPELRLQRINRHKVGYKLSSDFNVLAFLLELGGIVEFLGLGIQNSVHLEWPSPICFSISLLLLLCSFAEGDIFRMHKCH